MRLVVFLTGIFAGLINWAQQSFSYIENHEWVAIDTTTLRHVEDYGRKDFVIDLGNHGSPEFHLTPELDEFIINDYSILSYQSRHEFRKYRLVKPIVDAKYVVGSGAEQHFSLVHSQNLRKYVNYSIGVNKINSKGLYNNQSSNYTDIYLHSFGEKLAKGRYWYDLSFNYVDAAASLNGGLVDDSTFINDTLDLQNRELLNVNLQNAFQDKKMLFTEFKHAFTLVNKLDSNEKGWILSLDNEWSYSIYNRNYYDSVLNTDFYDRILIDSTVTNDFSKHQTTKGFLGFGFSSVKKESNSLKVGVQSSYNTYNQLAIDTFRWDIEAIVSGVISAKGIFLFPKFSYLLNDAYSKKDYNLDIEAYYFMKRLDFRGRFYLSNERPQIDLLQYEANNVSWTNNFSKYQVQHFELQANYSGKINLQAKVNYLDIHNPIYFGYDKTPYQIDGVAQLIRSSLEVANHDNDRWDLDLELHYQYQGGYNVFRLPGFLSQVSGAYKFKAFKKKMDLAIGGELSYFSRYASKSFDPISGQYYIADNQELGGYPYMDVFLKGRVQRATFFLMMSHPHQGLFGYNYFYFPNYPANDRFFRLGVSWLFVN